MIICIWFYSPLFFLPINRIIICLCSSHFCFVQPSYLCSLGYVWISNLWSGRIFLGKKKIKKKTSWICITTPQNPWFQYNIRVHFFLLCVTRIRRGFLYFRSNQTVLYLFAVKSNCVLILWHHKYAAIFFSIFLDLFSLLSSSLFEWIHQSLAQSE